MNVYISLRRLVVYVLVFAGTISLSPELLSTEHQNNSLLSSLALSLYSFFKRDTTNRLLLLPIEVRNHIAEYVAWEEAKKQFITLPPGIISIHHMVIFHIQHKDFSLSLRTKEGIFDKWSLEYVKKQYTLPRFKLGPSYHTRLLYPTINKNQEHLICCNISSNNVYVAFLTGQPLTPSYSAYILSEDCYPKSLHIANLLNTNFHKIISLKDIVEKDTKPNNELLLSHQPIAMAVNNKGNRIAIAYALGIIFIDVKRNTIQKRVDENLSWGLRYPHRLGYKMMFNAIDTELLYTSPVKNQINTIALPRNSTMDYLQKSFHSKGICKQFNQNT